VRALNRDYEFMMEVLISGAIVGGATALLIAFLNGLYNFVASKIAPKLSKKNTSQGMIEKEPHAQLRTETTLPIIISDSAETRTKKIGLSKTQTSLDENTNLASQLIKTNDGGLGEYPNAQIAIKYRDDAKQAWTKAESLPHFYKNQFLMSLDKDPQLDSLNLLSSLQAAYQKELRPFKDEAANSALEQARTISTEAAIEFKKVYETLNSIVPVLEILEKIETEFGPSKQTIITGEKNTLAKNIAINQPSLRQRNEARGTRILAMERETVVKVEKVARKRNFRNRDHGIISFLFGWPVLVTLLLVGLYFVAS
jgi:hypothetical protein